MELEWLGLLKWGRKTISTGDRQEFIDADMSVWLVNISIL